jgi:hypothetical protein
LGGTVIAYGRAEERETMAGYIATAEAAAAPATADRLEFRRSTGTVAGSGGDLIDTIGRGEVSSEDLDDDLLTATMRDMSPAEREAYIAEQTARRAELQTEIDGLLAQRRTFLDAERERMARAGELRGFDAEVELMIRDQAERVGITFE